MRLRRMTAVLVRGKSKGWYYRLADSKKNHHKCRNHRTTRTATGLKDKYPSIVGGKVAKMAYSTGGHKTNRATQTARGILDVVSSISVIQDIWIKHALIISLYCTQYSCICYGGLLASISRWGYDSRGKGESGGYLPYTSPCVITLKGATYLSM